MKWTPFWVQIYNVPLMSMTREFGLEIGGKIGRVLNVDVPKQGVQWGKYLQVRVCVDAIKKLVRREEGNHRKGGKPDGFFSNMNGY